MKLNLRSMGRKSLRSKPLPMIFWKLLLLDLIRAEWPLTGQTCCISEEDVAIDVVIQIRTVWRRKNTFHQCEKCIYRGYLSLKKTSGIVLIKKWSSGRSLTITINSQQADTWKAHKLKKINCTVQNYNFALLSIIHKSSSFSRSVTRNFRKQKTITAVSSKIAE